MKKLLISVITLFILCPVFSEEIIIHQGTTSYYGNPTRSKEELAPYLLQHFLSLDYVYAIIYETDNNQYYLVITDYRYEGWIHLNYENIVTLRYILNKYLEWESMAIEKQVAIEKDIPDSQISTEVSWFWWLGFFNAPDHSLDYSQDRSLGNDGNYNFNDVEYSANHFNLDFVFFSPNENRHQLVITSNKVRINPNDDWSFSYSLIYLHLNKKNVSDLLDGISDESIENAIDKYNNRDKIYDEFQ